VPAINSKITPCLWFDTQAEEAARFYTSIFDNSRIKQSRYVPQIVAGASGATLDRLMDAVMKMKKFDLETLQRAVSAEA
jgi:predicted 3-demethylubiquinone-9 3-methyltransferase (glyoxalase superfamily)